MSSPQNTKSPKEQLLHGWDTEHATTLRVLRAYPEDKLDLRPHPKSKTARELAWMFVLEQGLGLKAVTTGFDWSNRTPPASPPATMSEIIDKLEESHKTMMDAIRAAPDSQLYGTVQFPTGPKQMGDVQVLAFHWFLMGDQIHHRGQFSVYLRMADAKVPSIYGPSADEPWF